MTKMNNFYALFPGGYVRDPDCRIEDDETRKVISTIDQLISESDFDIKKYEEIIQEYKKYASQVSELFQTAQNEGIQVLEECLLKKDECAKKRDDLIEPIYDLLIKSGYSERLLRQ